MSLALPLFVTAPPFSLLRWTDRGPDCDSAQRGRRLAPSSLRPLRAVPDCRQRAGPDQRLELLHRTGGLPIDARIGVVVVVVFFFGGGAGWSVGPRLWLAGWKRWRCMTRSWFDATPPCFVSCQMTTSWETCSPDVRVTSMELINRDDVPLLAVGTKRGVIRVWRDFYDHGRPKVSAWLCSRLRRNRKWGGCVTLSTKAVACLSNLTS